MKHVLLLSANFKRAYRRVGKSHRDLVNDILQALERLEENPHQAALKTHKLSGALRGSWACSAGYDLRIIFHFTRENGEAAIFLEDIGTHDEVY